MAETALNTVFDDTGPLLKCWEVSHDRSQEAELILCFHHAIINGTVARLILHEFLSLVGGLALEAPPIPVTPPEFPPPYRRGKNLYRRLVGFSLRQLKKEWQYSRSGLKNPIPDHSANAVISLRLDPTLSRSLVECGGCRPKITCMMKSEKGTAERTSAIS